MRLLKLTRCTLALGSLPAVAAVPSTMTYEGYLTDANDAPPLD